MNACMSLTIRNPYCHDQTSGPIPTSAFPLRRALTQMSESKHHSQLYDPSGAVDFDLREHGRGRRNSNVGSAPLDLATRHPDPNRCPFMIDTRKRATAQLDVGIAGLPPNQNEMRLWFSSPSAIRRTADAVTGVGAYSGRSTGAGRGRQQSRQAARLADRGAGGRFRDQRGRTSRSQ